MKIINYENSKEYVFGKLHKTNIGFTFQNKKIIYVCIYKEAYLIKEWKLWK